jgi:hypothetical protein
VLLVDRHVLLSPSVAVLRASRVVLWALSDLA